MKNTSKYSTAILICLFASNSFFLKATEIPIRQIADNNNFFQEFPISLIIDSSRNKTFDEILNNIHNAELINSRFTIPSIDVDYWFIFKAQNTKQIKNTQIIGFDEACLEIADIYYQKDSTWIHKENGLFHPVNQRDVYNRWPVFEIDFETEETKMIILKMHSKYVVPVGIICESTASFQRTAKRQAFAHWLYFGAAFAMMIYNLFLYFQLRDKTYLYYVCYVFFLLIWILLYSGFFLYISSSVKLFYFFSFGVSLMGAFIALFTREILKPKLYSKWIDKVLLSITWLYIVYAILVIINISFYQYLGLFTMPITLFLLIVGVISSIKKVPLARYYVFGSSVYIIGLFLIAGLTIGAIGYSFASRFGFIIGSFIELSVFAFALGQKIKLLQNEKMKYQNQIILAERTLKEKLEIQVQERTKKLEENNKTKDKLFSIISHDLRSPFNSVLGLLDIVNNDKKNLSDKDKNEYLKLIYQGSQQVYTLLDNLLLWSRSQTNGISYNPVKFDITKLIQQITQLSAIQAKSKNIELKTEDHKSMLIKADENMIKTVIRNLISNAIKFTPQGGSIYISFTRNLIEKMLIVSIKDSGIGMNKTTQKNIFNLNTQYTSYGTENEKGTGLGLIICKDFIHKHQGDIWVDSSEGKGSTFYFSLPISESL